MGTMTVYLPVLGSPKLSPRALPLGPHTNTTDQTDRRHRYKPLTHRRGMRMAM
jgi:hypothetical protein